MADRPSAPIPARAGIGLRAPHYRELLTARPAVGFLEVHSENYFGDGGAPQYFLQRAREQYPVSLHGVGLSLGSTDPLDQQHLARLRQLIARTDPMLVSEHLCWSSVGGRHLNDLLPLPGTEEALAHVAERIRAAQDFLGRQLLIENLSSYVRFSHTTIPEAEFLAAVADRADCLLLLDINNVYVSCRNHGYCAQDYLAALPATRVREIHLAGHSVRHFPEGELLIDSHNTPVCEAVWALYRAAIPRFGHAPTLVEWDNDLPPLATLVAEARKADLVREEMHDSFAA